MAEEKTVNRSTQLPLTGLAVRVHDMVGSYVRQRAERRSNTHWDTFKVVEEDGKERRVVDRKFAEAYQHLCQETFLRMRGLRSHEDFVAYFTGTTCSVPQYLPRKEYLSIATQLLDEGDSWEDVKSLAMLALSALSSRSWTISEGKE